VQPQRGAAWARVDAAYQGLLTAALARPFAVLAAAVRLLAGSLVAIRLGLIKTDVFPSDPSRFARFDLRTQSGTSFEETSRISERLERALRADPRVQDVAATVGLALDGAAGRLASNRSFISVALQPGFYGHAAERFLLDWKRRVGADRQFTGATVRGRAIDILQQTLSQGADALEVQLYGPDVAQLYALGQAAAQHLAAIPGIVRPDTNISLAQPELELGTDRLRLAQLHLAPADVSLTLRAVTSGVVAGNYRRGSSEYPIVVQLPPSGLRTSEALAKLELMAEPGAAKNAAFMRAVPFAQLGPLHAGVGPSQTSRQGGQRRIDVDAALVGIPLGNALSASSAIMSSFPLPPGYRWQFGPEVTRYADTYHELALTICLAIVLVFLLLAAFFDSFFEPLLIMVSVPFAIVGVALSLWLTQRSFGLTATIGCLMLVGITVKNAILLVDRIRALRLSGYSARQAVLLATPSRLRPIVMTTAATIGGMIPLGLALEPGAAAQVPLGTVVIGGLLSSTILSLFVIPAAYIALVEASAQRCQLARQVDVGSSTSDGPGNQIT
jgi:HAE1 family hydrophobic/amphiphilic exporter-1